MAAHRAFRVLFALGAVLPVAGLVDANAVYLVRAQNTYLDPATLTVYDMSTGSPVPVGVSAPPVYVHVNVYTNGEPIPPQDVGYTQIAGVNEGAGGPKAQGEVGLCGGPTPNLCVNGASASLCLVDYCVRASAYLYGAHAVTLGWGGADLTTHADFGPSWRTQSSALPVTAIALAVDATTTDHVGYVRACVTVDDQPPSASALPSVSGGADCVTQAYGVGNDGLPTIGRSGCADPDCVTYVHDGPAGCLLFVACEA